MPAFSLPIFVEAAARASVILATTGLVAAALRRSSASARHLVWVLGLASALLVPALSMAVPKLEVPIVRVPSPAVEAHSVSVIAPVAKQTPWLPPSGGRSSLADNSSRGAVETDRDLPAKAGSHSGLPNLSWGAIFFFIWALGAAVVLGRMLLGILAVQWMSRRTRAASEGPWLALARGLTVDLGLKHVRFVQSATASMPMAWGVFRASVLMPAGADAWPAHRLRVVLLHELAHVKRRDCLTHLVAQIVCAAYWFNPLAWIAARRLRTERERACDDLVLAMGTRGSDYADELLDIARVMQSQRFPAVLAGATLAMAHRSQLEGRLMAILDPTVPRRGLTRARIAVAAAVFAILIISVASVQPWAETATAGPTSGALQTQDAKPIESYRGQAAADVRANAREESRRQDQLQTAVQEQVQGRIHEQVHGAMAGGIADTVAETASSAGKAFGTAVGNAVGGAVLGVVGGVTGGISGGVSGGVKGGLRDEDIERALEHALPFALQATPMPTPTPTPNPNPNPRSERDGHAKADPRAVAALMEALKDSDKEVRETAMHALVQMRDPRIFEPLVAALKDSSPDVREQAVFGLGQLRDPRAVDPLTSMMHDPNADVREQAVFALGQLHSPKSVEPLMSALKDENPDVREQAAFALGQIRDPKAVEALVIALKDNNADVREQAAFALGQLRDPRAIDGLTAAMKDSNADVRKQAAFALGQIRY
jgi:beta-lactamase regulating signal transducer with metallopeptidase domain